MTDQDLSRRKRRRSIRRRCLLAILIVQLIATLWIFRNPLFRGNFGVVEPGSVYRSSQPTSNLAELIHQYRIASVLNLRGGSSTESFYADEVRLTRETGLDFYDLPLSATRRPTRRELLVLLDLFERCRYPLLIHCKSGADRTGLACSLYLMVGPRKVGPDVARRAFSLDYGHVGMNGTERLHEPIDEYADWLKAHRLDHTPGRFRGWVEHDYASPDTTTAFTPLQPGPRARIARQAVRVTR